MSGKKIIDGLKEAVAHARAARAADGAGDRWIFEASQMYGQPPLDGQEGPWPFGYISTPHPTPIFELSTQLVWPADELERVARTMAASGDLLKAAKRALRVLKAQGESVRPNNVLGDLESAISKAEAR